jgi:putative FmdB family regulatory protein
VPTYQYACTECGHTFERFQGFSEDALTHCPECDGRLRKVFNAVGVVFKGSGFYRTDSRAGSSASVAAGTSPGAESKDSGSKDSGSKESGSKESGSKDSGSNQSGSKDSGGSKSGGSSAPASTASSTS